MAEKTDQQSVVDKSLRSVFVGNIPYGLTEEKLKDIFNQVGPVLSFQLLIDRETGKPKGYGFCEYQDRETALSAIRNLNGFEIDGRVLRVDAACTAKSRMEMEQWLQASNPENPYGDPCDPDKAPEVISKTVASLPPEEMFKLMREMQLSVHNNPSETRQMLLSNPQLAYGILQTMVATGIVDRTTASSMLFKSFEMPTVLGAHAPSGSSQGMSMLSCIQQQSAVNIQPMPVPAPNVIPKQNADIDLRALSGLGVPGPTPAPRQADVRMSRNLDKDMRSMPNQNPQLVSAPELLGAVGPVPSQKQNRSSANTGIPKETSDEEKAVLIMQVMQMSEDQIAQLPLEKRTLLLNLKQQFGKGI